jgi:hypothetical protein
MEHGSRVDERAVDLVGRNGRFYPFVRILSIDTRSAVDECDTSMNATSRLTAHLYSGSSTIAILR